nr:SusD/RagB family nutrient-binding outer membrane lipoprotein [uncultured Draconibacterium sp.]
MKRIHIKYLFALAILTSFFGCQDLVDDINDNPNQLTVDAVDAGLFLKGAEIENMMIQLGTFDRVASYYSGQLIGYEQIEQEFYSYIFTDRSFDWDGYQSVLTPLRDIRERKEGNFLYMGITKVVEAHLIGTYASLFGDIPYSEALNGIDNPVFDNQKAVFSSLQSLLSEAISDLENVTSGDVVTGDYIFNGDAEKWLESAYTLKARYYMLTKEYSEAYSAAMNGISSAANSMMFVPYEGVVDPGSKNTLYARLSTGGYRVGVVPDATHPSYLLELLDSRSNSKTNEEARTHYYTIDHDNADGNTGIAAQFEPQPLVSYQENLLILAEAGARSQGFSTGLEYLNTLRAELSAGAFFNESVESMEMVYDPYEAADFDAGGIENEDGSLSADRALLREIVEERYLTGFMTFMPYNDTRRLQKDDSDIAVPFGFNTPTQTANVERLIYPSDELESNTSSPAEPGAYAPTEVNR